MLCQCVGKFESQNAANLANNCHVSAKPTALSRQSVGPAGEQTLSQRCNYAFAGLSFTAQVLIPTML